MQIFIWPLPNETVDMCVYYDIVSIIILTTGDTTMNAYMFHKSNTIMQRKGIKKSIQYNV